MCLIQNLIATLQPFTVSKTSVLITSALLVSKMEKCLKMSLKYEHSREKQQVQALLNNALSCIASPWGQVSMEDHSLLAHLLAATSSCVWLDLGCGWILAGICSVRLVLEYLWTLNFNQDIYYIGLAVGLPVFSLFWQTVQESGWTESLYSVYISFLFISRFNVLLLSFYYFHISPHFVWLTK